MDKVEQDDLMADAERQLVMLTNCYHTRGLSWYQLNQLLSGAESRVTLLGDVEYFWEMRERYVLK